MNKKVLALILSLSGLLVGILGYGNLKSNSCDLPQLSSESRVRVKEIIDGDTFEIKKGYSVRILNIDAPEKGEKCYLKAKNRLEDLILEKEVLLKNTGTDKYCRYLGEVYYNNTNIGRILVKEGLALAQNSSYIELEKEATEEERGCLWQNELIKEDSSSFESLTPSKTGLGVVNACNAKEQVGREVLVEGKVADVYHSDTDTIFLNFEKVYPNQCFTAVIFKSDLFRFPSQLEERYYRKTVRVKGIVEEYEGRPEIILKTPSQIEIKN